MSDDLTELIRLADGELVGAVVHLTPDMLAELDEDPREEGLTISGPEGDIEIPPERFK